MSSKMMIIIAPTERYRPLPLDFKKALVSRTSFLKAFFSTRVSSDLSMAFISFKRSSLTCTSAGISFGISLSGFSDNVANEFVGTNIMQNKSNIRKWDSFFNLIF